VFTGNKELQNKECPEYLADAKKMRWLINSAQKPKSRVENYCKTFVDFFWDGLYAYAADRLHPEDFTLDFSRLDKWIEIGLCHNGFAIAF
jgi:hypothetical protein